MRIFLVICFHVIILTSCFKNKKEALIENIETTRTKINTNALALNDTVAKDWINHLQEFAMAYPKDSLTPIYLFDAASVYRYLHQPHPALEIYKKIYAEYPTYSKNADCLFLQGMVLANEMNQKEEGIKIYNSFMEKYPHHFLTPQIALLIEQMNMTDEELIESFKKKNEGKPLN